MPKMDFPHFDGCDARVWLDKCSAYFALYQIPLVFRVSVASIHMSGAATHWFQTYKLTPGYQHWDQFTAVVVSEFEVDTDRSKMMELLNLKQTGLVDDYRKSFEHLVYHIKLYDNTLSNTMLTTQFILGLKDELRSQMEMQLLESIARVGILASIQEKLLDKTQCRVSKPYVPKLQHTSAKSDSKTPFTSNDLWKARQLREHRHANGLCFKCGDKFIPRHKCAATPPETPHAQVAMLTHQVADGGELLSDDLLNALEGHLASAEDECFVPLNATSSTTSNRVIHLRALIKKQVLSILVDSGNSHSFLNAGMLSRIPYTATAAKCMTVRVANGQ
jgi:hypothetical protein